MRSGRRFFRKGFVEHIANEGPDAIAIHTSTQGIFLTRELIAEQGGDVLSRARGAAGEAKVKAGDLFEKGREYFEEQTNRLITAFEAGKSAMREEIRQGRPDA